MTPGPSADSPLPETRAFHTTHWSMVAAARGPSEDARKAAMERLCRTYWLPLFWFVRRKGHNEEDARDLTQGFFERFIEKNYIDDVHAERGRFRSWLLSAMTHFLLNEYDRTRRLKRGGGVQLLSLDGPATDGNLIAEPDDERTPERVYEQQWVQALLARVLERLREECAAAGREQHFEVLKVHLTGGRGELPVADAAAALDLSEAAAKSAIHRLRQRYGKIFREEVAHTLTDESELEDEIRYLLSVMSG